MSTDQTATRTDLVIQCDDLRSQLAERSENLFASAASHVKAERCREMVVRACVANTELLACERKSLFLAVAQAATLGLEIDSVLGQAYLVPFRNNAAGTLEVQLIAGYQGLKELAYRSGLILSIDAEPVFAGEPFEYQKGTDAWLRHRPSDSAWHGAPTHVYCVIKTVGGGNVFKVMSWEQIEAHKKRHAKGWQRAGSAWQHSPTEMALKTVLRRALKLCPLSAELRMVLSAEESVVGADPDDEPEAKLTEEQCAALREWQSQIEGFDEAAFLGWLGVPSLADVPASDYEKALQMLRDMVSDAGGAPK